MQEPGRTWVSSSLMPCLGKGRSSQVHLSIQSNPSTYCHLYDICLRCHYYINYQLTSWKWIFRRKKLVLADHVPGTQDYSGMSFEALRAALHILSEVAPNTNPFSCLRTKFSPVCHYQWNIRQCLVLTSQILQPTLSSQLENLTKCLPPRRRRRQWKQSSTSFQSWRRCGSKTDNKKKLSTQKSFP